MLLENLTKENYETARDRLFKSALDYLSKDSGNVEISEQTFDLLTAILNYHIKKLSN